MNLYANQTPFTNVGSFESVGLIVFALLSPLWFFSIGGTNLNPADFVLLFVFVSFTLRTGLFPYSELQRTGSAVLVFLAVVGLSVLWSSNKIGGLLSFAQYLFIFLAVVPVVSYALRDRFLRWNIFLAIWATTTVLTLFGFYTYIFGDVSGLRDITIWYGNQNQFFWLVASSFICNIAIILESSLRFTVRLASALLSVIELVLIIGGMTLSAILMICGGLWLFTAFLVKRRSEQAIATFLVATVFIGVVSLAVALKYWEFVYIQGSLHVRIPQYITAIHQGIQHFPLGMGIDAYYPSVHNFFLNYFVEIGIIGASAFFMIIVIWCRGVLLCSLRYPSQINPFEFAFIAIFGMYAFVIIFQPIPVRRFWWMLFAASWAVIQDRFAISAVGV